MICVWRTRSSFAQAGRTAIFQYIFKGDAVRRLVVPSSNILHPFLTCSKGSAIIDWKSWTRFTNRKFVVKERYLFHSSMAVDLPAEKEMPKIRVLYGTTGGTAQLFSMQLAESLEDQLGCTTQVQSLQEYQSIHQLANEDTSASWINFFVVSTTGVGEPTADARPFYEHLMAFSQEQHNQPLSSTFRYAIFALGNKAAHPMHYNVVGKNMQSYLDQVNGAQAILPLALGDDGECIEDDFSRWEQQVIQYLKQDNQQQQNTQAHDSDPDVRNEQPQSKQTENEDSEQLHTKIEELAGVTTQEKRACPGARYGERIVSTRYPFLLLEEPTDEALNRLGAQDLLDVIPNWYDSNAKRYRLAEHKKLNSNAVSNGMVELSIESKDTFYEAGDHFVAYPRNPDYLVEAYLDYMEVKPHAVIAKQQPSSSSRQSSGVYHHPTGITLYETLSYCVDLNATPNLQFVRMITKDKIANYKEEVAMKRRTVLDMALESGTKLALEDVLYNLPPMRPRYYSISSSPRAHVREGSSDNHLIITFRPVRYVNKCGALREGACTSYLDRLTPGSTLVGSLRTNPSFRLPADPKTPIVMIAGGCGVAPIRAFLEERLTISQQENAPKDHFGKAFLFLGFRTLEDVCYRDLVDSSLSSGVLSEAHISTDVCSTGGSTGNLSDSCIAWHAGNVTSSFSNHGALLWDHFQQGGYTYLCGGARTFGAAVEAQVVNIIQSHGKMSAEDASAYLRNMIAEKRFLEDLAD